MPLLHGSDGQTYRVAAELNRGGEGIIHALQGRPDVLAKLYLPGQDTPARQNKLRAMLADPPRDEMRERFGHAAIAWPLAVLEEGGRFVGFLMPRIDAARPLLNAYNPQARDALPFDWRGRHQVAANLCAALNALHAKGYVVGDLNPRNILVNAQGLVTLVDTDSFQVRVGGVVHHCPVGTPEYTPWELQGQHFDRIDRSSEHDRFGLAVLVFQLLMGGRHPFTGALKDPRDSLPGKLDEWCIQNGAFPWVDHPRLRRPPGTRPLEDLPEALRELFIRAFVGGHADPDARPEALEWHQRLVAAQPDLVLCAAGTHWRYPGVGACHDCQRSSPGPRTARPVSTPQPPRTRRLAPRPTPPSPPPQPVPAPLPQPARAPAFQWRRLRLALAFTPLAAALVFAAVYLQQPEPRSPWETFAAGMVLIPAGAFQMGCSPSDGDCGGDEKPSHRVKVRSFRMGRYEVTQGQWRAVMGSKTARFQGDDRPVDNVSWDDIQDFLQRLNAGNPGPPYRLPSEAEWEYAARAGTTTAYWWGKDSGTGQANCSGCVSFWVSLGTEPVGSFPANPFGLYDTVGNVWEWVADCWHDSYRGAPADGSAWLNNCSEDGRVLRGGSWGKEQWYARVSYRKWAVTHYRRSINGLRLAQDLNP